MVIRVLPPIHISPEKLKLKKDIKKELNKLKIKNSKNVKNNKKLSIYSIHDMHISKSLQDFEKSLMKLKVLHIYIYVCMYLFIYMYICIHTFTCKYIYGVYVAALHHYNSLC
jgi:hypothetical protein